MSMSKASLVSLLLAVAEARFGQEQTPVAAIQALGNFGGPGVAATIAGSVPGSLLAAASPCQKLTIADQLITELGDDAAVLDAAKALVAAETNFNPFAVNVPFVCADPALPATEALRGIIPLVDPAVGDSDVENANSATSLQNPFTATGLSQAEVMIAQGFSNFTAVGADGANTVLPGQDGAGAGAGAGAGNNAGNGNNNAGNGNNNAGNGNNNAGNGTENAGNDNNNNAGNDGAADDEQGAGDEADCNNTGNGNAGNGNNNAGNDNQNNNGGNNDNQNGDNQNDNQNGGNNNNDNQNGDNQNGGNQNGGNNDNQNDNGNNNGGNNGGNAGGNAGAADFGLCDPTMVRVGGLGGRPATEFTFFPKDPLVSQGQQEALNPNIITNRICDQLTNVCEASDDAKALCLDAKAQIEALGTRDQATADTWNALLGFAGADSTTL